MVLMTISVPQIDPQGCVQREIIAQKSFLKDIIECLNNTFMNPALSLQVRRIQGHGN